MSKKLVRQLFNLLWPCSAENYAVAPVDCFVIEIISVIFQKKNKFSTLPLVASLSKECERSVAE